MVTLCHDIPMQAQTGGGDVAQTHS